MKKTLLLFTIVSVTFSSCKKNSTIVPNEISESSSINIKERQETEIVLTNYFNTQSLVMTKDKDANDIVAFHEQKQIALNKVNRKINALTVSNLHFSNVENAIQVKSFKLVNNDEVKYRITHIEKFTLQEDPQLNPESRKTYDITLKKINGAWLITNEFDMEDSYSNTLEGTDVDETEDNTGFEKVAFSRTNVVNYALKWWSTPNPFYYWFGNEGGNCTNFASQCMKAGGHTEVQGASSNVKSWWYKKSNYVYPLFAKSWPSAHGFYVYLTKTPSRATAKSSYMNLDKGDIIQIKYPGKGTIGHSMVVTSKSTNDVFVTYNSVGDPGDNSQKNVSMAYLKANKAPGCTFYYWKIK